MSDEVEERRQAEISFVAAAYPDEDEAWVEQCGGIIIHRRLQLSSGPLPSSNTTNNNDNSATSNSIHVIISISMPEGYPAEEDAVLDVKARISNDASSSSSSSSTSLRKQVMDALPSLIGACRSTAQEYGGSEAVFAVLGRADEWVSTDWVDIIESSSDIGDTGTTSKQTEDATHGLVFGRRLIYSHHIIAPSKRKAIVELAQHYNLGGYVKIGWPGIIIIEGEETDCISYVDEIRGMRWQHLVVRGEQHTSVQNRMELEEARVLPGKMQEVGDKMSIIAEHCKRAGLEELFMTSMKIYKKKDDNDDAAAAVAADTELDSSMPPASFWRYGALCHVDHMNDGKNYRKWLRKAAAVAGCTLMLKMVYGANAKRPLIIVAIVGEEDDVKRVLKRWRTSRVDVDSAGRPCLERMMTVLVEGRLGRQTCDDLEENILSHMDCLDEEDNLQVSGECLSGILHAIGGAKWSDEFQSLRSNRR